MAGSCHNSAVVTIRQEPRGDGCSAVDLAMKSPPLTWEPNCIRMAKNQNTIEKRRREMEKRRKAEEKRERRRKKKTTDDAPSLPHDSEAIEG